jgi:hypothetical protein
MTTYLKTKHTYFINVKNKFFHGFKVLNIVWKSLEMGDTAGLQVSMSTPQAKTMNRKKSPLHSVMGGIAQGSSLLMTTPVQ